MIPHKDTEPYYFAPNSRTGRYEVFLVMDGKERLVGSIVQTASDFEIASMVDALTKDPRCK